ncbi:MAG: M48 family metalloprotease [Burkholderiales bacterium]|nr:M48 family metalloprotease [Burkholderiales bacterium]
MNLPFHSSTRRAALAAVSTAALLLGAPPAAAQGGAAGGALPSLGEVGEMTPLEERKLGDAIARELYRDPDYIDDPVIGEYVDGIWRALLAGARTRGELPPELDERFAWQVFLGRDRSINAFALPGGYFGLNLGLVGMVRTRDELASVLGHEMSHVTQRHIARLLGQQSRQTPLLIAAMVAGAIAASKNPQAGAALAVGGQAAIAQQQLNFSRDMEREADRVGYAVMSQAGFAPQGFVSMFQKLQTAARVDDNGDWPYLRSHPLTTQRIADMQQRVQALHLPPEGTDWETVLVAARARVLSRPGVDVLRAWAGEPAQPDFARQPLAQRAGALYAAALARAELRELPQAQTLAERLAPLMAEHPRALRQVHLLQAELALRADQAPRALAILATVPTTASVLARREAASAPSGGSAAGAAAERGGQPEPPPGRPKAASAPSGGSAAGAAAERGGSSTSQAGRAVLMLRTQALLRTGQAGEAASQLRTWVADHAHDSGAWQALAQADAAQGQMLRSLRAEGEVALAQLDYAGAVNRWRAAQDYSRQHPGDSAALIEASIVDARMREAQALLQQQRLEEQKNR